MRLPGYLRLVSVRPRGDGTAGVRFVVRRWHPSFWLEVWRSFRRYRVELTVLGRSFVLQEGRRGA